MEQKQRRAHMGHRTTRILVAVAAALLLLPAGTLLYAEVLARWLPGKAMATCRTCHNERGAVAFAQEEGGAAQPGEGEQQGEGAGPAEGEGPGEGANIPPSTADHSQFEILQQDFASGPAVTEACLTCHTEADVQLHATVHWNWEFEHPETGQLLGKRHVINNSTLAIEGNVAYCATCHNGYGLSSQDFDFTASESIDCLSCHDTTGEYEKLPGAAGHPAYEPTEYPPGSGNIREPPDLSEIAQQVGPTSRETCGSCHFSRQAVNPVIHGQLPSVLLEPNHTQDVHMDTERLDFSCSTCHEPQKHAFFASQYWPVSMREDVPGHLVHATCVSCHEGSNVHPDVKLNQHMDRVACQTCHIPTYGRAGPTMTAWDWSTAGRTDDNGNPMVERNADDLLVYDSRYGSFEWGENLIPEYVWFTGTITYTKVGDPIPPDQAVVINELGGSYADPQAQLWPVARLRGHQPYDTENNYLVAIKLYGNEESAFWNSFNWNAAIQAAMQDADVPYSGQYGFVETDRYWLLNHMVAPADEAVRCGSCHSRDGRLAAVSGSYIPGRDYNVILDTLGWVLVAGALVGVAIHSSLRFIAYRRRQGTGGSVRNR